MITLLSFSFWAYFIYFIIAIFLAFYIPGSVLIGKLKLTFFQKTVIATILGMVLWGWQGFIFGYLGFRFLTYLYLLMFFLVWIYRQRNSFGKKLSVSFKKLDFLVVLIIIVGIIVQLLPVWGFGLQFPQGLYLCCGNREDLLLHLALTSAIIRDIPPIEPGMNGVFVQNYHYWANLVIAELVRIFRLPVLNTQFQYMNLFISLFLGLGALVFAGIMNISRNFERWLLFLIYFGGDAIFGLLLILGKGLKEFKNVSSIEDGSKFLINPPRAFSLVIALVGISLFVLWIKRKKTAVGILSIILLASTIGFKVYTGLFVLMGVSVLMIDFVYKRRYKDLIIAALVYPISAIIYFSNNASAGGLIWAPFHMANNFLAQSSFGLKRWELARLIYVEHKNFIRILEYNLISGGAFFVTLCGTKIIAFFQSPRSLLRLGKEFSIFLLVGTLGSFLIGFFFLQQSGGANTFNFIVSFWFFLSIPAALAIDYWQKKINPSFGLILIFTMLLLTVPRVLSNTYFTILDYVQLRHRFITNEELQAFNFIRQKTSRESLFIVDPYRNDFDQSTPYISAFTDRPMFISGEHQLWNHGIDIGKRMKVQFEVFNDWSMNVVIGNLYVNKIDYVIFWQKDNFVATRAAQFTKPFYSNPEVKIVKVDKDAIREFIKAGGNKY